MKQTVFGGVEFGGTKVVCAVATSPDHILEESTYPTSTPDETIPCILQFFVDQQIKTGKLAALGIASFGPLDLKPHSPSFGQIISTPKKVWEGIDIIHPFQNAFNIPVYLDTDVNGAALGEWLIGSARGLSTILYMTVGTGIGMGAIISGKFLHGFNHPEYGHIRIPHNLEQDPFTGSCPYHGDCLEGLASGSAMQMRWSLQPEKLPNDHQAWELEAQYLAYAITNLILSFSPERIILGGGIMHHLGLVEKIKQGTTKLINGYENLTEKEINQMIVEPLLGNRAGVCGAIGFAMQVYAQSLSN